jgi:membrane protein
VSFQASEGKQDSRGREAIWPSQIPFKGWKDIFWRLVSEIGQDRVMLIAAGSAFYLLLALFPALAAFVSLYGIVSDPATVAAQIQFLTGLVPAGGLEIVNSQLTSLAMQPRDALSFGFLFSLALALWSANNGIKTLFEALNVAYEETEKRGFIKLHMVTFGFTLSALLIGIVVFTAIGLVPALLALFPLGNLIETLIRFLRWPLLLLFVWCGIAVLYRYGPSRARAKWRWITAGGIFATIAWFVMSIGFSYYLENFANYNAVYGSLGAVVGFMMWAWLSMTIVLVGAELNSEIEHQTRHDSTTGPDKPMGERGAYVADTVGRTADEV